MEEGRRGGGRGAAAAPGSGGDGGGGGGVRRRRPHNMAGAEPFGAVLGALRDCYAQAAPLETFVRRLRESGAEEAEVVRDDDAPCYRTFVSQCVVCVPHGARDIPRPFSFEQVGGTRAPDLPVEVRGCPGERRSPRGRHRWGSPELPSAPRGAGGSRGCPWRGVGGTWLRWDEGMWGWGAGL